MPALVCPKDRTPLRAEGDELICIAQHRYPVVEGVPVLLRDDYAPTMSVFARSLEAARNPRVAAPFYLASMGMSEQEREIAKRLAVEGSPIDPVVSMIIAATNGIAYKHLAGRFTAYPIPELRLPPGEGKTFVDIGCNWGRWTIAAARKGYRSIGIDPSLGAVIAAKRVARELGLEITFICGDARCLPFSDGAVDTVFSYSVLQHFAKPDAIAAFDEISRVLKPGGSMLVQMAHSIGLRSLYHQLRRGFRDPISFEVRYWTIAQMQRALAPKFASLNVDVHCYFGLGLEPADAALMPRSVRIAIRASEILRAMSRWAPPMKYLADSVYVAGTKA
jgi:SAM-dependent methyltransferase/uncharacterized protein YbaR (Trm112 family)